MKPPRLDPRGKDQSNTAIAPDQEVAYDKESGRSYLDRVVGTETTTPEVNGAANTKALALGGKQSRRRQLLTQRILAGLAAGDSVIDIADELGVATSTVTAHVARHKRSVEVADIDERLDQIAVPLAADNLIHGLIAGDKDYTLETLKGRGKLRRHTADDTPRSTELPVLRISIDVTGGGSGPSPLAALPVPTADQTIAGGRIVGAVRLPKLVAGTRVEDPNAVQIAGTPRETT